VVPCNGITKVGKYNESKSRTITLVTDRLRNETEYARIRLRIPREEPNMSWHKLILAEMQAKGDTLSDMVAKAQVEDYNHPFLGTCYIIYTHRFVYFPQQMNNVRWYVAVPRNPDGSPCQ